ncbi:hypothetical protein [Roseivivax sp. CAU 1753]
MFQTDAERAAFAAELRAALLADPEIVDRALNPPAPSAADLYLDARNADLALIAADTDLLFGAGPTLGPAGAPVALAFLTDPDCAACIAAQAELEALLTDRGARARIIDATTAPGRALMDRLTLDALPSYVLPEMMVRGAMPSFVLGRYLDQ